MSTQYPNGKITLPLLLFLSFFLSGFDQTSLYAQVEKERELIKAVITKETAAFMNVDHRGWAESWIHSPYSYWSYADSTGSSFIEGWDAINSTYDNYFKTAKPSKSRITDEWIEVRVYGTGAYVRFIQKATDDIDVDETSQVRVLEKKEGKWKVVHVGVVAKYRKPSKLP